MTHRKPKILEIPPMPHYVDQLGRKRQDKRRRAGQSRRKSTTHRTGHRPRRGRAGDD